MKLTEALAGPARPLINGTGLSRWKRFVLAVRFQLG